jgi:hypothetical protein
MNSRGCPSARGIDSLKERVKSQQLSGDEKLKHEGSKV